MALATAVLAAASACTGDDAPAGVQVADSAGVAVVQAPRAVMEALPTWTTTTVLEVGGPDATGPASFFTVLGVHRRDDGGLAVLDAGSQEVRFFGPDGAHEASVGGEGEGPGEFRRPVRLAAMAGDSLLVWDQQLARISVVGPGRRVARTAPLEGPPTSGLFHGILADGRLVFAVPSTTPPTATVPVVREAELRLHRPDGTVDGSIGPFPYHAWYRLDQGYGSPVFGPSSDFSASGDGIWVGAAGTPELVRVDTGGSPTRIVRWWAPERPVTQELRDHAIETAVSRAGSDQERERARAAMAGLFYAPRLPAYQRIFTDEAGAVWVQGYDAWNDGRPVEWTVFDSDGRPAGRLELPGRFRLWEVRDDHLAGVLFDDLDVPRVVVVRVARS